jgi:hypothetical protein
MFWAGINPFDYTPVEIYHQPFIKSSDYLREVFNGISDLSKENYTIYPSINQFYFIAATSLSDSVYTSVAILRILTLLTFIPGIIFLRKTLILLGFDPSRSWILYLNPLWIVECMGNLHFEGVMISFLFIAFYFLVMNKSLISSFAFSLAVNIKLIPLIILPFLWRRLKPNKAIIYYQISLVLILGMNLIFLNSENVTNFLISLRLYFGIFEFNSFIQHYVISFFKVLTGWRMIREIAPVFSLIILGLVSYLAFKKSIDDWQSFFKKITLGLLIYLLLTSTVHPWYILPLLALSVFTEYSFAIIWSCLVFLSYSYYAENSSHLTNSILVAGEYLLLGHVLYVELISKRIFLKIGSSS